MRLGMIRLSLIAIIYRAIYFVTTLRGFVICLFLATISWFSESNVLTNMIFVFSGYFIVIFVVNKVIHLEINDYILVNRLRGSIHMNFKTHIKYLKSDNDAVNLKELYRNFINGIYEIPSKTKYSPLLRSRKKYYTKTHEAIFKIASKEYKLTENDYELLKDSIIREKIIMKPIKMIFDEKQYKWFMRKTKKYKIYINMDDVKVAVEGIKALNN